MPTPFERATSLAREHREADAIRVLREHLACHGDDVGLAPVVSGIAHSRKHPVTALYIVAPDQLAASEDETFKTLRASVEMLVIVSDQSYVPAMIAALGS